MTSIMYRPVFLAVVIVGSIALFAAFAAIDASAAAKPCYPNCP